MMNSGTMSDQLREAMNKREKGGDMPKDMFLGQFASTVRSDQDVSGASREYVWYDPYKEIDYDAPDDVWEASETAIKIYGNWNEYAQSQNEDGEMILPDDQFPFKKTEDGTYVLDESTLETTMQDPEFQEYQEGAGQAELMSGRSKGGPGASQMEDLLERLGQYMKGGKITKYARGGKFYGGGGTSGGGGEADSDDAVITDGKYSPFIKKYQNGGEIRHGRKRLTVGTSRMGTDSGTMINPTFYADGEPVSPREAANIYKADYLRESDVEGTGAPDFNRFVQNAIMRSLASKGQMGGMRDTVRSQQREFMEDRKKAGVKGLLRGLSNYRP